MLLSVGACLLPKYFYLILTYYEGIPCTEFEIYRESQGVEIKEIVGKFQEIQSEGLAGRPCCCCWSGQPAALKGVVPRRMLSSRYLAHICCLPVPTHLLVATKRAKWFLPSTFQWWCLPMARSYHVAQWELRTKMVLTESQWERSGTSVPCPSHRKFKGPFLHNPFSLKSSLRTGLNQLFIPRTRPRQTINSSEVIWTESIANDTLVPKCLNWISRTGVHRTWPFFLTTAPDSASAQAIFLSSLLKKGPEAGALGPVCTAKRRRIRQ